MFLKRLIESLLGKKIKDKQCEHLENLSHKHVNYIKKSNRIKSNSLKESKHRQEKECVQLEKLGYKLVSYDKQNDWIKSKIAHLNKKGKAGSHYKYTGKKYIYIICYDKKKKCSIYKKEKSDKRTNPKTVDYNYILHGHHGHIRYTVYGGLNDYLRGLPRKITYVKTPPTEIDFIKRDLNDENQKQFLDPFVDQIKAITSNQDDQARIAISLVQNLDYDWAGLRNGSIKGKYPYEVLYTGCGVCSEKSKLLAYLLRELGYGIVIFRYESDNHDAIGLRCPLQYSYKGTGYCFVESTSPTIITDSSRDYYLSRNGAELAKLSDTFRTLKICDGNSFDSVSEEYNDSITYNSLTGNKVLNQYKYDKWKNLVNKYGMKTESK